MNDFLSKLENLLFDILGLVLPGAIFLLILLSPILFLDIKRLPAGVPSGSALISALVIIYGILKDYWSAYPKSALTIAAILSYLTGHTVKVVSRMLYEIGGVIFDRTLNRWLRSGYRALRDLIFPAKARSKRLYLGLQSFAGLLRSFFHQLFDFIPKNHFSGDKALSENNFSILRSKTEVDFPGDDYALHKMSGVISNQESLRTLGTFFLAKYNLYRSLSLIFLFTTIYYIYFFRIASAYISENSRAVSSLIFAIPPILWFTFHVKFKRYWTLYGQERILSLFYFLNKDKLHEGRQNTVH